MKAYIIQSGHFSQAGNFMGFSAKGEKIHIYKKHILELFPKVKIVYQCLGRYEKELVTLPFYCLAEDETFDYMDCNGQKTGHKFTRLTAFVISDKEYQIKTAAVNHWADSKIKDLTSTIEVKDRDLLHYRTELETVRRKYDALDKAFNKLAEENDALSAKNQTLKWDLEYSQSERERLELLCKEHEYTIMELETNKFTESQKTQLKIAQSAIGLTKQVLDKLIDNV
jgi:hypothetical protein